MAKRVDLRKVIDRLVELFAEYGYRNHATIYDQLFIEFGCKIFEQGRFCSMAADALSSRCGCAWGWDRLILLRWFEDKALIQAGFREWLKDDD